jgi:hypothetical protein
MSALHILLENGLRLRTICNYSESAMIPPALPSASTMSGKGAGPATEASMTGRLMKWGHTQRCTMPAYSRLKPRVQLCIPKYQYISLSCHLQVFGRGWTPMAAAVCGRTSHMTVTESGFWTDYAVDLCVLHTTDPTWRKNTRLVFCGGNHFLLEHMIVVKVVKVVSHSTLRRSKQLLQRAQLMWLSG